MEISKILKMIVFIISFVMFCYQLNTATQNLMDPQTVLSQYERDAIVDDMPLITICPTNQINLTKISQLKYDDLENMLLGDTECYGTTECTSWGAHLNFTFDNIKKQIFAFDRVDKINISTEEDVDIKASVVFLPSYRFCKEVLLPLTHGIEISYLYPEDSRVSITDRDYKSFFMPDLKSHVGNTILMKPKTDYLIDVRIEVRSYCHNAQKPMSQFEYKKCVDKKLQKTFEQHNITCLPPWLSSGNQCNQTYSYDFYGEFAVDFYKDFFYKVDMFSNTRFEEECQQSCKETKYVVNLKGEKSISLNLSYAYVNFNQKVVVTEKVPNYDLFKYIIDVGSSMGLWLGLSVFGLYDLIYKAVEIIKDSFIIKKIRYAITKIYQGLRNISDN